MKKRNSQLGKVFHTCKNYEELVQQLHDEAGVVGKKVEEVMKVFDLRNGYDREVMMIMITNIAAAVTSSVEEYNDGIESWMKRLYHLYLDNYRDMKKKEQNL